MTKSEFINGVSNWSNHRLLLWPALEATRHLNLPVLELGCGDGSTPYLRQYCEDNNLKFRSFDSNKEWAEKHGSTYLETWDSVQWFYKQQYSVVLIDESPGEHRREALQLFASYPIHFSIVIVHDSEPEGWNTSDYKVRPLFNKFNYVKDLESIVKGGAWASALSNEIDVTKFEV